MTDKIDTNELVCILGRTLPKNSAEVLSSCQAPFPRVLFVFLSLTDGRYYDR